MANPGLTISPIGFGAFKIGRNQGIKYADSYELPDEPAVAKLLNGILDLGINHIDTAPAYGVSEERIGRTIAHRRDEYFLSTKVGEQFLNGVSSYDYSRSVTRQSVHRSLRRLRTDVLDLVFVHSNRQEFDVLEHTDVVPTLRDLREVGVVKAIGFSGYTEAGFRAALSWADAIMAEYHPDDRSLEPLIREAGAKGVAVMVKKGLSSGRLPAETAIPFILSNPAVTSLVIGGLNLEHFAENLRLARSVRKAGRADPRLPSRQV